MTELFRNTVGPVAWTIIGLVPLAIFALYFLRLKREPVEVPSTYLWTKVIEDLHVNSLWQKLRRNLLLLLQLLLVGLAILALVRPGWQGETLQGQRYILLVDRSASMSTTDVDGGSRLEAAKRRILALIDRMEPGMEAMIVAFDERPDVVQEFTDNHRILRDAVRRIGPTSKATNIRSALELAAGFARHTREDVTEDAAAAADHDDVRPVELYIVSDGRFAAVDDFSLEGLHPTYVPIGSFDANNLAITALNVRRSESHPQQRQAFLQVANFGGEPGRAAVRLLLDERLIPAAE